MTKFYDKAKIAAMRVPTRSMEIPLSKKLSWVEPSAELAIEGNWTTLTGTLELERMDERLDAHVSLSYVVECFCEVCGARISYANEIETSLVYVPFTLDPRKSRHVKVPKTVKDLEKISHQVTLQEDQLDVGWYDNGELDLSLVLTEVVVLARPSLLSCELEAVTRLDEGDCVSFPTEGQKNTHKPFANLPDLE